MICRVDVRVAPRTWATRWTGKSLSEALRYAAYLVEAHDLNRKIYDAVRVSDGVYLHVFRLGN